MTQHLEYPHLVAGSRVSIGDKYGPAMEITDPEEAARYFDACVNHAMSFGEHSSRAAAERVERANLGYYAGYYSNDIRRRVEQVFSCAHPIFGTAGPEPVDPGKALLAGVVMAATNPTTAAMLAQVRNSE